MKHVKFFLQLFFTIFLLLEACQSKDDKSDNRTVTQLTEDSPSIQKPEERQPVNITAGPWILIDRIREKQRIYVRDSYGIYRGVLFTEEDLNNFKSENKVAEIVNQLRNDGAFTDIVDTIRNINSVEQSRLLDSAQRSYRKPWSMLRLDPSTASKEELIRGQTDAGSMAERLIAEAIVGLVRRMLLAN